MKRSISHGYAAHLVFPRIPGPSECDRILSIEPIDSQSCKRPLSQPLIIWSNIVSDFHIFFLGNRRIKELLQKITRRRIYLGECHEIECTSRVYSVINFRCIHSCLCVKE